MHPRPAADVHPRRQINIRPIHHSLNQLLMLARIRALPYVLFLIGVSGGVISGFLDINGGVEPVAVIALLTAMAVLHLVFVFAVKARDRALASLRGPGRPARPSGLEAVGAGAVVLVALAAVFLDRSGIVASVLAFTAIGFLAYRTTPANRLLLVIPALLLLGALLVPGDAGFFAYEQGEGPFGRKYLILFSDQLNYLAVVASILIYKAGERRFLTAFGSLLLLFLAAAFGFSAPAVERTVLSLTPDNPFTTADPYDQVLFATSEALLGPTGALYVIILLLSLFLGIPLALRLAWNTARAGTLFDTLVARVIDANAVLITLLVALGAMSYALDGMYTPASLISVAVLYLFAVNELPLSGFAVAVLRPVEAVED